MKKFSLKIFKTKNVKTPVYSTDGSVGLDFFIPEGEEIVIYPGCRILFGSGIKVKLPENIAMIALNKSGIAAKKGLILGACLVDPDYQGEILINLINTSNEVITLKPGEKIIQFIFIEYSKADLEEVNSIEELYDKKTKRGECGFGSTSVYF